MSHFYLETLKIRIVGSLLNIGKIGYIKRV